MSAGVNSFKGWNAYRSKAGNIVGGGRRRSRGAAETRGWRRGKEAKQEIDIAYENELPLCRRMFHGNLPGASLFLHSLCSFSIFLRITDLPLLPIKPCGIVITPCSFVFAFFNSLYIIATFVYDVSILSIDDASQIWRNLLYITETKSVHVKYTPRRREYLLIILNWKIIHNNDCTKYLRMYMWLTSKFK